MNEQDFEIRLEHAVAALPGEREPRRDLWPGIASRLRPVHRPWVPGAAAAAVLALAAGLGVWFQLPPAPAPQISAPPRALLAASRLDRAWRGALLDVLRRHGPLRLSGGKRALFEAELGHLESAQNQIRAALAKQPGASYLVSLLAQTHAQRFYLVQTLAGSPAPTGEDYENGNA